MKTRTRLFLALAITFLSAFANSESARCEASGSNAKSAPCKAEAPGDQQTKRNYLLGHVELDADYKAIQLHDTFMMNGRKYHLLFVRDKDHLEKLVDDVYIYPDGFKSWKQGNLIVDLPVVTEFIVHNVPGQELWGSVVVKESVMDNEPANKKNKVNDFSIKNTYTDVRLPDEPAQKILDLIQDNSAFEYYDWGNGAIKYNRVQAAALRKTKIEKVVDGKCITEYTDKRTF